METLVEVYGTCSATLRGNLYIFGGTQCDHDGCKDNFRVQNQVK